MSAIISRQIMPPAMSFEYWGIKMNRLKGVELSVEELKTLEDAHIIISEMQDATNSESLARLKDDLGNLLTLVVENGVYTALDEK